MRHCIGSIAKVLLLSLLATLAGWAAPTSRLLVVADSAAAPAFDWSPGWASPLRTLINEDAYNVVDRAKGGVSCRSYYTRGPWATVAAELREHDLVLIQFVANEGRPIDQQNNLGSLPGTANDTVEQDSGSPSLSIVHSYGWYLREMVQECIRHNANPILVTSVVADRWRGHELLQPEAPCDAWIRQVAKEENVPLLDLNAEMQAEYEALGKEEVRRFFPKDHFHMNAEGAALTSTLVVAGLRHLGVIADEALLPLGRLASCVLYNLPTSREELLKVPDRNTRALIAVGDRSVSYSVPAGAGGRWSWGDCLGEYINPNTLAFANLGAAASNIRTFEKSSQWSIVRHILKHGDIVVLSFGSETGLENPGALTGDGALPGVDDKTYELEPRNHGRDPVDVHTYGWYLRGYIDTIKAAGGTPVVVSPPPAPGPAKSNGSTPLNDYRAWSEEVAKAESVPYVDLSSQAEGLYGKWSKDECDKHSAQTGRYTNLLGARALAQLVVEELKTQKIMPAASAVSVAANQP